MENKTTAKILIADDQEGMRESLAGILELEGYEVHPFEDGYKALEKARQMSFDFAILDIKMPGINGVETFLELKKISPHTIVFMMTAYADQELIRKALNEGAYGCIYKPLNIEGLLRSIGTIHKGTNLLFVGKRNEENAAFKISMLDKHLAVIHLTGTEDVTQYLTKKIPDTVILDILNDDNDGIETLKILRNANGQKAPRIVIIAEDENNAKVQEAKNIGFDRFINKPVQIEDIEQFVKEGPDNNTPTKLLIVDDDKNFLSLLQDLLTEANYTVNAVETGAAAIEQAGKDKFDLALLDVKLPDMNGIDLSFKIKEISPSTGIIMMTAFSQEDFIVNALKRHEYLCLYKPFDPNHLLSIIRKLSHESETQETK